MGIGQRLAVHFIRQQRLRMHRRGSVQADVVISIRRLHGGPGLARRFRRIFRGEIGKSHAAPLHDVVPALDALELGDFFHLRQRFDFAERHRLALHHQFPVGLGIIFDPDRPVRARLADFGRVERPGQFGLAEQRVGKNVVRLFSAAQSHRQAGFVRARANPAPAGESGRCGDTAHQEAAPRESGNLPVCCVHSTTSNPVTIARKLFQPARITCPMCTMKNRQ